MDEVKNCRSYILGDAGAFGGSFGNHAKGLLHGTGLWLLMVSLIAELDGTYIILYAGYACAPTSMGDAL